MTVTLDCHPASTAERLQAYRNVHEFWGQGLSMREHLQRRLASPQHNRAQWFVGCVQQHVVTSLACYELGFLLRGQHLVGIAIGSVHTVPQYRGRGFAPTLIRWAEAYCRSNGAAMSLLYSDIAPAYYARLGYLECPSHEANFQMADRTQPSPLQVDMVRLDACRQQEVLADMYATFQAGFPFSIARSRAYWQFLLEKDTADHFYWVRSASGSTIGYVRLGRAGGEWRIRDLAFSAGGNDPMRMLLEGVISTAERAGGDRIVGWLPRSVETCAFPVTARRSEITMIKPLAPHVSLDRDVMAAVDHFHEIDHV